MSSSLNQVGGGAHVPVGTGAQVPAPCTVVHPNASRRVRSRVVHDSGNYSHVMAGAAQRSRSLSDQPQLQVRQIPGTDEVVATVVVQRPRINSEQ